MLSLGAISSNSRALWYLTRGFGLIALVLLSLTMVMGLLQVVRYARPGLPGHPCLSAGDRLPGPRLPARPGKTHHLYRLRQRDVLAAQRDGVRLLAHVASLSRTRGDMGISYSAGER